MGADNHSSNVILFRELDDPVPRSACCPGRERRRFKSGLVRDLDALPSQTLGILLCPLVELGDRRGEGMVIADDSARQDQR